MLHFHIAPEKDPTAAESFKSHARIVATAYVGERVTINLGDGTITPRSVELLPTIPDCPPCRRPIDEPSPKRKPAVVANNTFIASAAGRYRLRVFDSVRSAELVIGVLPVEALAAPALAIRRNGPDQGKARPASERRAILRAYVRDVGRTAGVLEELTDREVSAAGGCFAHGLRRLKIVRPRFSFEHADMTQVRRRAS